MRAAAIVLMLAVLGGCDGAFDWALFERVVVTSGGFRGIRVGATKEVILTQIQKLGVYAIKPAPAIEFRLTKRNISEIERVQQTEGIRISGAPGLAIDLFFREGRVWLVRKSIPAKDNQWFSEGMPLATAMTTLGEIVQANADLEIIPIVFYEGNGWIEIAKSLDLARRALLPHNAWMFEISSDEPAGAFVSLYFKNDTLARIEYRRPRIRLN